LSTLLQLATIVISGPALARPRPDWPLSIPRVFVPVHANGQLAFGTYKLIDGEWLPNAIHVLTLNADGLIVDMFCYLEAALFPLWGLPPVPPDTRNSD